MTMTKSATDSTHVFAEYETRKREKCKTERVQLAQGKSSLLVFGPLAP